MTHNLTLKEKGKEEIFPGGKDKRRGCDSFSSSLLGPTEIDP